MSKSLFQLQGKRVLVIGGASGMGAAAATVSSDLGAELTVLDVADISYPVAQSLKADLRDKDSVNKAINDLQGSFDIVYACAGVADGTPGLMLINFTSQRTIIESLAEQGRLNRGGSIVFISSVAGLPFRLNQAQVLDFLATNGWDEAVAWIDAHEGTDDYSFSKQAINGYVESKAYNYLKQGLRVNAVMPGPTDTPLARANADAWLGFGAEFRDTANIAPLTPEQIASAMAFYASDAAAAVNGTNLLIDNGHVPAATTDSFDEPAIKMMLGMS